MASCSDHQLIAALRALDRSGEFDIESLDLAPPSVDATLEQCLFRSLEERVTRLENAVFRQIEVSSADGGDGIDTANDEVKDAEAKTTWETLASEIPLETKRIVYPKADLNKMRNGLLSEGPVSRPQELENYFPRKVEYVSAPKPPSPPSISTDVPSRIVTLVQPSYGKAEDHFRHQSKPSPGLFAHLQSPKGQYPKKTSGNGGSYSGGYGGGYGGSGGGGEEEEDIKKPYGAHGGGGGSRDHRDNYQSRGDGRGGDRGDKDTRSDRGGMKNSSNNENERSNPAIASNVVAEVPIGGSKIDFAALIAAAAVKDETKDDMKRARDNRDQRESRGPPRRDEQQQQQQQQQRRDNRSGHKAKEKTDTPPEKTSTPMKTEYQYGLVVRSPSDA